MIRSRRFWSTSMLAICTLTAGLTPACAADDGGIRLVRGMASGPVILVVALAALAAIYLASAAFQAQRSFASFIVASADKLTEGRAVYPLWGVLAELLLISAGMISGHLKILGLVTMLLFATAIALAGVGVGVSAIAIGRRFESDLLSISSDDMRSLSLGLRVLFVAVILPFVGWIVTILVVASGIGAALASVTPGSSKDDGI